MFKPVQQYKIAVSGTSTAAQALAETDALSKPQALLYAKGCDVVVALGTSAVAAADGSATSNKLVAGMFLIPEGSVMCFDLNGLDDYIRVISEDELSTGTLFVTIGQGE